MVEADVFASTRRSNWTNINKVLVELVAETGIHYTEIALTQEDADKVLPVLFEKSSGAAKHKEVKGYLETLEVAALIALSKEILQKRS